MSSATEFDITTDEKSSASREKTNSHACARLFPANAAELDTMLSQAEATPASQLIPAVEGFKVLEGRLF